jgi:hypothetical protein
VQDGDEVCHVCGRKGIDATRAQLRALLEDASERRSMRVSGLLCDAQGRKQMSLGWRGLFWRKRV